MSVEDRVSARNARKTSAFRFASDMKVQPLACPSELAEFYSGFYLWKNSLLFLFLSLFSYFFKLKTNFSFFWRTSWSWIISHVRFLAVLGYDVHSTAVSKSF